ncbi:MAG: MBL fold metallo-hydrolase [Planctomycetota bacterium]
MKMGNLYRIERFELGPLGTNCYLVVGDDPGQAVTLIDAGSDPEPVLELLNALGRPLDRVLLTHAHADHIAGLAAVREAHPDVRVWIHPAEAAFLGDANLNLSVFVGDPVEMAQADGFFDPEQSVEIAGLPWHVLATPGHSPGGVTFYEPTQGISIVGDTLFAGGVGRTDFPTSNPPTLIRSIREQLLALPDDTRVLPGHGPETTVGHERATNPWLRD